MSIARAHCSNCNNAFDSNANGHAQAQCPHCGETVEMPAGLSENAGWFYVHEGKKAGPIPLADLQHRMVTRQLGLDDMVLKEGTTKWITLQIALGLEQETIAPGTVPVASEVIREQQPQPSTSDQSPSMPSTFRTAGYSFQTGDHEVSPSLVVAGQRAQQSSTLPQIPGYQILGELGRGGMGVVYKARHLRLNRTVALKMIIGGGHLDPHHIARFRSEAEAVARFQHPNIIQVFDINEYKGAPFCALEFVEGGTLEQRLAGTPLPGREAAKLMGVLANAMELAHQKNIVHRDLKPGNVLLGGAPGTPIMQCVPKISDFGLVKRLDNESGQTQLGAIVGTPSYMSPEQARGDENVGPLADVYGLGAITYQLLTGKAPFRAATVMETLDQVRLKEPVPPREFQPGLDRDVETICLKCLEKDPAKRYATAGELAQDLARYLNNQPIVARPASRIEKAVKFTKRNPVTVGFSTLLTLVLIVAVFLQSARIAAQRKQIEARDRATNLEKQVLLEAAKVYRKEGKLIKALKMLDLALKNETVNEVEVKYLKAQIYAAQAKKAKVQQLMAELLKHPNLGDYKGRVLLLKADTFLDNSKYEEAFALMREALTLHLPKADQHYAQAILAPTTPEAIRQFKLVLKADPLHYSARAFLSTSLLLTGRLKEARELAIESQAYYRDDPGFKVLMAMLMTMQGEEQKARQFLQETRASGSLEEKVFNAAVNAIDTLNVLPNFDDWLADGRIQSGDLWTSLASSFGVKWLNKGGNQDLGVLLSAQGVLKVPPVVSKSLVGLTTELSGIIVNRDFGPDAAARMKRALEKHPEGLLWMMYGSLLFKRGEHREAEEALMTAATSPSMAKLSRTALYAALRCQQELLTDPNPGPDFIQIKTRAHNTFFELRKFGRGRLHEMSLLTAVGIEMGEIDEVRTILTEWRNLAPGALEPFQARYVLEMRVGNYLAALRIADAVLKADPNNQQFQQWRTEAVKKIREVAGKL